MEVGNVVLLQALSPGRLFPPAPVLLQLSPPSLPHLAYTCNFLATPNQQTLLNSFWMKTFLAWLLRKQLCDNIHEVYYFANRIQHILSIFCMLATYKLKQIMWCTTISVQYFTAQVPEKISKLKAEVKLTRRSCFNKQSPLTLPALQRFVIDLSIVRLPELEDIGRPRGWLNFFCFLPSDAP